MCLSSTDEKDFTATFALLFALILFKYNQIFLNVSLVLYYISLLVHLFIRLDYQSMHVKSVSDI